jgi:hypothetical protein
MADIELVEKLRERASVSYDEAKEALDACDDDLLEAIIYLEKRGKVPPPRSGGTYSSREAGPAAAEYTAYQKNKKPKPDAEAFSENMHKFGGWLSRLFKKSIENLFVVSRKGKILCSLPVLVVVLLLLFCFWPAVVALIVGLFLGCRYVIRGPEAEPPSDNTRNINSIMDEVAEVTENFKNEFKANHMSGKNDKNDKNEQE